MINVALPTWELQSRGGLGQHDEEWDLERLVFR